MKLNIIITQRIITFFILSLIIHSCKQNIITIDDSKGIIAKTNAPVSIKLDLNKSQVLAAKEGRLVLVDLTNQNQIPVQLENYNNKEYSNALAIISKGESELHKFKLLETKSNSDINDMKAYLDSNTTQYVIEEEGKKVLQYNYQTVYEKDVIRPESSKNYKIQYLDTMSGIYFDEYLKNHPTFPKDTIVTGSIYAIPRSNYIHPLYGLEGEMLTSDWPDAAHPHHRGIFWAWPEVQYGAKLGDIYALQTVFARPTGNIEYTSGPVFAEIDAENLWMWEDKEPIVQERSIIRVYHSTTDNQIIDLTFHFLALKDSITIATRFTDSYGGLNIKMQTPKSQDISYFSDEPNSMPLRSWADFNGVFEGNTSTSGLMLLQHQENPEYPGDWVEYPGLSWVQPTFPSPGTRYPLSTTVPLTLRYRLIVHANGKPTQEVSKAHWEVYNSLSASK
ncbi:DUF6807 family protein [Arenibacter latericius]|uniref:DUF6807 family protein n=1 Tax=Arenibacter latericius TaxID=86104 RepID=UPI0004229572|nr:DUF6807 family protein [Arenibacter latericius]